MVIDLLVSFWQMTFGKLGSPPAEKYLGSIFMLDHFAKNKNNLFLLIETKGFRILHVSENWEEFSGYSKAEFERKNIRLLLECVDNDHLLFFYQYISWTMKIISVVPRVHLEEALSNYWCGLKATDAKGLNHRLIFKVIPLHFNEKNIAQLALVSLEKISHLLKGDSYWMRLEAGKTKIFRSCMFQNDPKIYMHDVISDREREIVAHVALGLESKEIGERLHISPHTVDKHRKNMIARLGVRDSVALVEICQKCDML